MTFARSFPLHRLPAPLPAWFADLLRAYAPAGSPSLTHMVEPARHLRVAIRDGYLNFYRAGQSLALVRFSREGHLVADIHHKYVYPGATGQGHLTLGPSGYPDADEIVRPYTPAALEAWSTAASGYTGAEKRFVDALVSVNADVVDLEMALPASTCAAGVVVAPRMDLVALEPVVGTSNHRIVFWEAKRVTDGRCRCRGDEAPEVVSQLAAYTAWLAQGDHRAIVAAAYQEACRELVALHALAATLRADLPPLGPGIRAVAAADAPLPLVDDRPRLIVDDREGNASFEANGHLSKLRGPCGLFVQVVKSVDEMGLASVAPVPLAVDELPGARKALASGAGMPPRC
jgi:hypothetical protein